MGWKRRGLVVGGALAVAVGATFALGALTMPIRPKRAPEKVTRTSVMELRRAATSWRGGHAPGDCPTSERLKSDGAIDRASRVEDAWGAPFRIVCREDETIVYSVGPDGREGTSDDIRVPESAPAR